jgi:DNA-directed RNA polymerase specialized sigma subunit
MGKKIEPPCEEDIRNTLAGDRDSRNRIISHYQRLICYMLHKEIDRAAITSGFTEEMYQFDDLLHDNIVLLENAILTFKDY